MDVSVKRKGDTYSTENLDNIVWEFSCGHIQYIANIDVHNIKHNQYHMLRHNYLRPDLSTSCCVFDALRTIRGCICKQGWRYSVTQIIYSLPCGHIRTLDKYIANIDVHNITHNHQTTTCMYK